MKFINFFSPKPRIAKSKYIRLFASSGAMVEERKIYYIVASVEVGNTTTKCIITATDLDIGKTYLVSKTVNMTRDVRRPRPGEKIFGETIWGVQLTEESIAELVADSIVSACLEAGIGVRDLDFVVRSTGVVAHFENPDEIGFFIKALAKGALLAGVPSSKMVPAITKQNLPEKIRDYSMLDKVTFDGAVAGMLPPRGSTGAEIVANEMEGELSTAGIKEGAKWTDVDFRNPCISMDFGTTFKGRIVNDELPYARTIGNFCGLGGGIVDAITRGYMKKEFASVMDIGDVKYKISDKAVELAEEIHKHLRIERVKHTRRFGMIPVNTKAADEAGVVLIGCDAGINGDKLKKLEKIGSEIDNSSLLCATIDVVMAKMFRRVMEVVLEEGLFDSKMAIGITGRAGITKRKPWLFLEELKDLGIYDKPEKNIVFVDDGLARGAAVMARCMNALGTPTNPIGGVRYGRCILGERIKYQRIRKYVKGI